MQLKIDEEFKNLIHPLTNEEFSQLEENILKDGCLDAIRVWNETIIDGHHRYKICKSHELSFNTKEIQFDSREDAVIWMCQNQRGRRSSTKEQKDYLLGKEYEATKKKWGRSDGLNKKVSADKRTLLKPKGRTREILGQKYGVGKTAVMNSVEFSKGVDAIAEESPAAKEKILSGQTNMTKKSIIEIAKKPKEEVEVIVKQIESGEYKHLPKSKNILEENPNSESPEHPIFSNRKNISHKKLNEVIRSIKEPKEMIVSNDTNASTLANDIKVFINNLSVYTNGLCPVDKISEESKKKITTAICEMETAVTSIKKIITKGD